MNTKDLVQQTHDLKARFDARANGFDIRDYMLDLTEELGELAQAVLIVEKRKTTNDPSKARTVTDVADGLSDMLFDMLCISKFYDIDLFADYERMLSELEQRLVSGEFDTQDKNV